MPRRIIPALALALVGFGCASMQDQFTVRRSNLSCEEANRYAFQSVRSMGYDVTEFRVATVDAPGILRTRREKTDAGATKSSGVVHIACEPGAVELSAAEDQFLKQDLTFSRGFYLAFTSIADHATASAAYADERRGGVTGGGVKFRIEPQIGLETKLDFGEDLAAGNVLAVEVTVQNGSARTYALDPTAIELRPRAGREKTAQVPIAAAAAAIARATAAELGEGAPAPDPARVEAVLRARALRARTLAPGDAAEGFLYFPTGDYARARATLIDSETGEREGFLVEF